MVSQIGRTTGGNIKDFQGLSTDPKPLTNIGSRSTFYELDSKDSFVYDELNVCPATSNNWWPV